MKTLYLSGPMAGYPEWNHPAFHEAAGKLRAAGHTVLNPADYGLDEKDWTACLRRDLHDVLRAEAVAVLPGWQRSRGAALEVEVAQRLGMPIYPVNELLGEAMPTTELAGLSPVTLAAVNAETIRAQVKHGDRSYLGDGLTLTERLAGLVEEVGEVGRAMTYDNDQGKDHLVKELIQVSSVAASWAEWLDSQPAGA